MYQSTILHQNGSKSQVCRGSGGKKYEKQRISVVPLHFFSILQWGQLKFFLKGILKITLTGVAEIIADLRQRHVGIH